MTEQEIRRRFPAIDSEGMFIVRAFVLCERLRVELKQQAVSGCTMGVRPVRQLHSKLVVLSGLLGSAHVVHCKVLGLSPEVVIEEAPRDQ